MAPDDFESPLAFTEDPDTEQAFIPDPSLELHMDETPEDAFDFNVDGPVSTPVPGPTGATGAAGAPGRPGTDGADGEDGERGPPGPTGSTGATGASGSNGSQGVMGPPGSDGPEGPPGEQGPRGLQGETGAVGAQGVMGPPGSDGPEGPDGPQGPLGPVGPTGATGAQGSQGMIGITGPEGEQGPEGFPGPRGETGITGTTGATGAVGPALPLLWVPEEPELVMPYPPYIPPFPYRFHYKRGTDITITKNLNTVVVFDTLEYDNTGAFNTGTGVFTPTVSGYYQINLVVHGKFASGTYAVGDFFILSFGTSAAAELRRYQQYEVTAVSAVDIHLQLTGGSVEFLTAGTGYGAVVIVLCANNQTVIATGLNMVNSFSAHIQSR